jgi:hypothetical protein
MSMRFGSDILITPAVTPTAGAAGTTLITGATLDTAGYRGTFIMVNFGAIVGTAVTSIKLQQGAAANMSDAADLLGSGQTVADTASGTTFCIDVRRTGKRYIRVMVSRGTANATVANAFYLQYEGRRFPVTQPSGINIVSFSSPIEGTP